MCFERDRVVKTDPVNPNEEILDKASELIRAGKLVVVATDTSYMLSANALDVRAIRKVFELKGRPFKKPIHVIIADIEMAKDISCWTEEAELLSREFWPGPLTLVLKKRDIIPSLLVGGGSLVGMRIPANYIARSLSAKAQLPLTATSANLSGGEEPYSLRSITAQFGKKAQEISLFLDQGELPRVKPSTLLDLTSLPPKILRAGAISKEVITKVVNLEEEK